MTPYEIRTFAVEKAMARTPGPVSDVLKQAEIIEQFVLYGHRGNAGSLERSTREFLAHRESA